MSTSYRRTSASVRGTPTLNCTVSDRQSRPRYRIGVLDTGDLRQHLLGRPCHHVLHIGAARSGKAISTFAWAT